MAEHVLELLSQANQPLVQNHLNLNQQHWHRLKLQLRCLNPQQKRLKVLRGLMYLCPSLQRNHPMQLQTLPHPTYQSPNLLVNQLQRVLVLITQLKEMLNLGKVRISSYYQTGCLYRRILTEVMSTNQRL